MFFRSHCARLALITIFLIWLLPGCLPNTGASEPRSGALPDGPRIHKQPTLVETITLPGAQPTRAKPGVDASCLLGDWEVANLADAMTGAFEQARDGSSLALQTVGGAVRYRFDSAGQLVISYVQLSATLSGSLGDEAVRVLQVLDGSASAHYQIESSQVLALSEYGGEGVRYAFEINDQRLAEGSLPAWRAFSHLLAGGQAMTPSPLMQYVRLAVTCEADHLSLNAIEAPDGPRIEFQRID